MTQTGEHAALVRLRDVLAEARFPLPLPGAATATGLAASVAAQLDDYLIPRLTRLDAPLLAVVGGSTGAGKSTLVNSLVRAPVSVAGARRPTTRTPVLVCHPDDAGWFGGDQLLPRLSQRLNIVPTQILSPGLALLDAPDIDSVEDSNRALAVQLLAAGDLWLFVTTAVRYADAVPWDLLIEARDRGTAIAIVLNRVPPGAEAEVRPHLAEMLAEQGLGNLNMFVIPEDRLDEHGLLPDAAVADLREWTDSLARSAAARAAVVRQTLDGALAALAPSANRLATEADAQASVVASLGGMADNAYHAAEETIERGVRDGALFRGEVLARWQDLVGTGEFMRSLQARVGRWRDRLVSAVTGRPLPAEELKSALESHLVTFVHGAAADAAEQAVLAWQGHPAAAPLLARHPELAEVGPDLDNRIERIVRDWQRWVLELIRTESSSKLFTAKASAYAVNALGLALMIVVFAATAFIPTGAEIAVAGGTTVVAQKVLEAIFGDEVVRRLASQARRDLLTRVNTLLSEEAARFHTVVEATGVDPNAGNRIRAAASDVDKARSAR